MSQVETGTNVTGRVVFKGTPLAYYGVAFVRPDRKHGGGVEACHDVDGRFALRGLDAGTWQLMFIGPGTKAKRLEPITVTSGQAIDVGTVVLEPGQRIAGLVRDVSGAPIGDARVFVGTGPGVPALNEISLWFMGRYETRTDSSGAYVFEGIDIPEATGPRFIWSTHSVSGASLLREVPLDDSRVDLALHRTGRIEGVVEGLRAGRPFAFAKHPEEPEQARRRLVGGAGEFCFDDVPPGDYEVSLHVPKSVDAPPVRVTVVEGQTATVTVTMATSSVQLTVTVPPGRGKDLVLASADSSTPELEQAKMKIIKVETKITMKNGPSLPWTGKESITFDHLPPGNYRASIDGETWTPIVVAASPEHQRFEIKAAQ